MRRPVRGPPCGVALNACFNAGYLNADCLPLPSAPSVAQTGRAGCLARRSGPSRRRPSRRLSGPSSSGPSSGPSARSHGSDASRRSGSSETSTDPPRSSRDRALRRRRVECGPCGQNLQARRNRRRRQSAQTVWAWERRRLSGLGGLGGPNQSRGRTNLAAGQRFARLASSRDERGAAQAAASWHADQRRRS